MWGKTGSRYGRYMEVNYFTLAEVSCGIYLRVIGYDTVMNREEVGESSSAGF
jgi:hypothetical protein